MNRRARWFLVLSPEYGEVVPVLDFGQGPTEYGRDAVHVRTHSKARAKVLALRHFRRHHAARCRQPDYLRYGSPFAGMIVEYGDAKAGDA